MACRFFTYLNLFMGMMLILVLGSSFLVLFVGWEGVGLCSYLLIGFWYEDIKKASAGMKAFLVNRIGDFGFMIAMLLIFANFGTLNIARVVHLVETDFLTQTALLTAMSTALPTAMPTAPPTAMPTARSSVPTSRATNLVPAWASASRQ